MFGFSRLRGVLNWVRNTLIFRVRYPWVKYGHDVHCQWSVFFNPPHRHSKFGDHVGIGPYCMFLCDTEIGSKVLIGPLVGFLNSDDHIYDVVGKTMWDSGRGDKYKIVVEDDVWIGQGAILLTPVRVGRGAIVAAGSIVVRDVPRYAIVGGNPAKVLKMRFSPKEIEEHERILAIPGGEASSSNGNDSTLGEYSHSS